jgi:hypothetical protein
VSRSAGAPILAAVLLLVAGACAGDDPTGVTLTNDDCTYEGPDSVDAGTVALDIENESDEFGVFELVRIEPGRTPDELESFIAEEQESTESGQGHRTPEFVTVVIEIEVNPKEAGVLNTTLTAGHHAVICSTGAAGVRSTSVHATESFEVT